jgi:hypothetical protein
MIPLIAIIGAAVGGLAVIVVAFLKWSAIVDWFKGRRKLKEADKKNIAFTIHNALESGHHGVVQGIFNTDTNEVLDGQKFEAKEIAAELEQAHETEELVVYN